MTNTNNEFLRPCDIEEGKDTSRLNNAVFNGGTREEVEALLDECEKCPKYSSCDNAALLNDRLKILEVKELTDPKEQWEALKELVHIEDMEVEKIGDTTGEYSTYSKYKVVLETRIRTYNCTKLYETEFSDSIMNHTRGERSADVEIFGCIYRDMECARSVTDLQDFCESFGYEIKDLRKAQEVYEACRVAEKYFEEVFTKEQLAIIAELLDEWGY